MRSSSRCWLTGVTIMVALISNAATVPAAGPEEADQAGLELAPDVLESRLGRGETEGQALEILNFGDTEATALLFLLPYSPWVPGVPMDHIDIPQLTAEQSAALTSRLVGATGRQPAATSATGEVVSSWAHGLTIGWGLGVNQLTDTIWVGDPGAAGGTDLDYEFTRDGVATGATIDTSPWAGVFAADMAFDPISGMLWQLDVGGINCIHELDPVTASATGETICWSAPSSERGLAYDPLSQTFFVGGWNTLAITRFDRAGNVLQVVDVGLAISGLAYNPQTEHLFVIENSIEDAVTVLDVGDDYSEIGSFTVPGFGNYAGAGLGISCDGHLWAANQADMKVYEIDSGETEACLVASLPWIELTPGSAVVPPDPGEQGQVTIDVQFIADGLTHFGLVQATVLLTDGDGDVADQGRVCMTRAFDDIAESFWADASIHATAGARITTGCGLGDFCPSDVMLRHVMANWLVKLTHGPDFSPPPCTETFGDVVCELTPNSDYVEQLYDDGITTGCSADPLLFCPYDGVTRAQMAVFLLRAIEGPDYFPPPCTGIFGDVNCPSFWAADWIEELYSRGITTGCSADPLLYCPFDLTNRAQMSAFVQRAWELPMCEADD